MTKITRIEVIDENGRSYVNWEDDNDVSYQLQDDGRTLKVFVSKVKPKSPAEEAFKEWWGEYPGTEIWTNFDETRWEGFKAGYNAIKEETAQERGEKVHNEMEEKLRNKNWYVDAKTLLKSNWEPKPQTPEETEQSLKEAFRKAVKQGVVSSTKSSTLYDLIADWWDEIFVNGNPSGQNIASLVEQIEQWLPKEQSAEGSQNAYVECTVEGFNDCLNVIKRKLK